MLNNPESIKALIQDKIVGKIKSDHSEEGHFYIMPSGKRVTSVTTKILSDMTHLIKWAVKMGFEWMEKEDRWKKLNPQNRDIYLQGAILAHTEYRDTAGSIGSIAHDVIDLYLTKWSHGEKINDIRTLFKENTDYRSIAAARSAEATISKYPVIPVASELLVGSDKFSVGGTLDALMWNTETKELELWDWKSSNMVADKFALQVSAYKYLFEEMLSNKIKIAKCRVIHLNKFSNKYKIYNVPYINQAFKAFKGSCAVSDWFNNGRDKLLEDKVVIKI